MRSAPMFHAPNPRKAPFCDGLTYEGQAPHIFSNPIKKRRNSRCHHAYVLALARIRFRGTRGAVHRHRPGGVAGVEHFIESALQADERTPSAYRDTAALNLGRPRAVTFRHASGVA